MKNIFAFSPVIKTLIFGIGLVILGSCSSAKIPEFSKNSLHKAENAYYLSQNQPFFKENDLKENDLQGKVKTVIRHTELLEKKSDIAIENPSSPVSDYKILFDRIGNYVEYIGVVRGKARGQTYFTYNPKERIVMRTRPDNRSDQIWIYSDYYDESGLKYKTDQVERNLNPKPVQLYKYHYDENKHQILWETTHGEKAVYSRTYKYDDSGNRIEYTGWDSDGKETWKIKKEYNTRGEVIEEYHLSKYNTYTLTFKYEAYDEQGNWTQRRVFLKEKPIFLNTRIIEYYE